MVRIQIIKLHTWVPRSQVDKREASMRIDKNGSRFDCYNKMGSNVARLVVGSGGGVVDLRDKFGDVK